MPTVKYPLEPIDIPAKKERYIKPLLVKNKVMVKGGYIQLTTHDGRNFLFKPREKLSGLKPGDTIVYNFNSGKIVSSFRFEEGVLGLIYWGSKRGLIGKIKEVKKVHPLKPRIAALSVDDEVIETVFEYVFPIGVDKPVISLGGVDGE